MSRSKSLVKNTIIIFIGTICTKLISFLLLPLYTYTLSASEYGIVDLLTTLISLISPIISLQISQGVFRNLIDYRNNVDKQKKVISTSVNFLIVNSIIYFFIFLIISPLIKNDYKWFLAITVIASVFSDLLLQISRGLGDNNSYSIAGVVTAIFTIICNVLFLVFLHMKVTGMLLGTLIGYIVGIIFIFFKLKLYKYVIIKKFDKTELKKLMKYSLPLVPNALSWWIFNTSDRLIVSIILGLSFTGILSVSYKFSSIIILFYNIFDKSWCESVILHIKDKDVETFFNKTFYAILKIFVSFSFCLLTLMPLLFKILVNSSFGESYDLIPIIIVASIFQVVVGLVSVVYAANDDTKSLANTAIYSSIVNLVIHLLLIKYIGIYAAVVSTLCSYLFFALYRSYDVNKRYIPIQLDRKFLIITLIALMIVIYTYYSNLWIMKVFGFILAIAYTMIFNKETLLYVKNIIISNFKKKVCCL